MGTASILATLALRRRARDKAERVAALRPVYAELLAGGVERFFQPERRDCPLCGDTRVRPWLSTGDVYQFKPGRFVLHECEGCHVLFQNPMLNEEGLAFYYRDFYDGLGADGARMSFAALDPAYRRRARGIRAWFGGAAPGRWLDVGAADGRFCELARSEFPATCFHGLDRSESVEAAASRGVIDRGFRGSLPELAPRLARDEAPYDVVSMFHYLEHALDPAREVAAAASLVRPGGVVVIDVPDPESRIQRALGRYGCVWLQPQHLHLLPEATLAALLAQSGLEVATVDRRTANLPANLSVAVLLAARTVAKPIDVPWRARRSPMSKALARAALTMALPWMAGGQLADEIAFRWLHRRGLANAYRVIARRPA